jgi:hypothetical protein
MDTKAGPNAAPAALDAVKDIALTFANAIGMFKIFPADHSSVSSLRRDFWAKLAAYLETRGELALDISENAFACEGEIVYEDKNLLKSLPYVFYKDGMVKMTFCRGLAEAEFLNFLELVKADAILPAEEGDIVSALWEREFPHIGYETAVDYLEAKTPVPERKPWDAPVDTEAFSRGRVDLTAEDMAAVMKSGLTMGMKDGSDVLNPADLTAPLDKKEVQFIASLIDIERAIPAEGEFLELFFELLTLEDRPASIATLLLFISGHHDDLIKKGDFGHAAQLLARMDALKTTAAGSAPAKSWEVDQITRRIRESVSLSALKEQALAGRMDDPAGFFLYLDRIGGRAIPLAADLFEEMQDGLVRSADFAYLKEIGGRNLEALTGLARDGMPFLCKGIIAILVQMKDRKAIPHLDRFKNFKDRAIRLEAAQALAAMEDSLAARILQGFAADADPEVRETARRGLDKKP